MNNEHSSSELNSIDKQVFTNLEQEEKTNLPQSLVKLALMKDTTNNIYNEVLFSIGNNHAGSYYPVTTTAIKFITHIALNSKSEPARFTALSIIADLVCFHPDTLGSDQITPDELETKVFREIKNIEPQLRQIFLDKKESNRIQTLLIHFINDFYDV